VFAALPAVRRRNLIEAMAALCDATARAEVVADVTPELAAIGDGQRVLDQTLATIDRCIARRAAVGDIAAALAASPVPGAATSAPARRPMTPRP